MKVHGREPDTRHLTRVDSHAPNLCQISWPNLSPRVLSWPSTTRENPCENAESRRLPRTPRKRIPKPKVAGPIPAGGANDFEELRARPPRSLPADKSCGLTVASTENGGRAQQRTCPLRALLDCLETFLGCGRLRGDRAYHAPVYPCPWRCTEGPVAGRQFFSLSPRRRTGNRRAASSRSSLRKCT